MNSAEMIEWRRYRREGRDEVSRIRLLEEDSDLRAVEWEEFKDEMQGSLQGIRDAANRLALIVFTGAVGLVANIVSGQLGG